MIVFLPEDTLDKCVDFIATPHLARVAVSCLQVARVLHEQDSMTTELRDHPAVKMWSGHEQYLVAYGLALIERYLERNPTDPEAGTVCKALETQMDLATTGGYDPAPPPWMGNSLMHQRFKRYLVSEAPHLYYGHLEEIGHWDFTLYVDQH